MLGLVFNNWIEEVERYHNYRFTFELCDNLGVVIMGEILNGYNFRWEKYYRWEDLKKYRLPDLLSKFVAEYNFKYEEYVRSFYNGKE